MARKKLKKKTKKKMIMWGIVAVIVIALLIFGIKSCETSLTVIDDDKNGDVPSNGNGGGGGGGAGDGNGEEATAPPEGGFTCLDCEPVFLEGNPDLITQGYIDVPIKYSLPFVRSPKGHWNCQGECIYNGVVRPDYNCVLNPVDDIPEFEYDEIAGEKPICWCLPQKPGKCNFYDANYGEGIDDLQCGGSCPPGEICGEFVEAGRKKCECLKDQPEDKCGFHLGNVKPESASGYTLEQYKENCYGWCEDITRAVIPPRCQFWVDKSNNPQCDCFGEEQEEPEPEPELYSVGTIFLSDKYYGSFNGLSGADTKCQAEATTAGLQGTYKALLSTSTVDAVSRIPDVTYQRIDGQIIASNRADLFDGNINVIINQDENGNVPAPGSQYQVYTGSTVGGKYSGFTCTDWTEMGYNPPEVDGTYGLYYYDGTPQFLDNDWIDHGSMYCGNAGRIYCVRTN